MTPFPPVRPAARAGAATVVAALALSACGSSSSSGESATGSASGAKDQGVAAEVPGSIASKGSLTVAADASYAPNEFIGSNGNQVVGMDADLAKALGDVMGLKMNVVNANFDSILPGLQSKKYDLGMSSFTDTKDREKTVDFVTYFSAGTSFLSRASGGASVASLDQLCGHKVAVEKGTTQQDDATKQAKTCKDGGKPGVDVQVYPDQNGVNSALSSNRADIAMADSPVAAYQVKQSKGQFKVDGQPYGTAPYGIAIPKGNGMAKPILDALSVLMKNGRYKAILQTWGISSGAIDNPKINGAES